MPKVCIVGGSPSYVSMFEGEGWDVVRTVQNADLVQFTGGADVSPRLYGEYYHPRTNDSARRDREEMEVFEYCVKARKPMAGICRGGQFLHVMNGGDMWQDVDSHAIHGTHNAFSPDGEDVVQVTSTHHQMMRVNDGVGEVLLIAGECKAAKEHMVGHEITYVDGVDDVECVYHEPTNCLCFQPHPEFSNGMQARGFYFRKLFSLFGLQG